MSSTLLLLFLLHDSAADVRLGMVHLGILLGSSRRHPHGSGLDRAIWPDDCALGHGLL